MNSYSSENRGLAAAVDVADGAAGVAVEGAPAPGRRRRPSAPAEGGTDQPFDPEAAGGGGRGRGNAPAPRVTKDTGMNRVVWDVRNTAGLSMPPGPYQARLTVSQMAAKRSIQRADRSAHRRRRRHRCGSEGAVRSQRADARAVGRVRGSLPHARAHGNERRRPATRRSKLRAQVIYEQLVDTPEGVRYNKPGLQTHIRYLGSMTANVDQKIGRDAIERYQVLKKEYDALKAAADKAGF